MGKSWIKFKSWHFFCQKDQSCRCLFFFLLFWFNFQYTLSHFTCKNCYLCSRCYLKCFRRSLLSVRLYAIVKCIYSSFLKQSFKTVKNILNALFVLFPLQFRWCWKMFFKFWEDKGRSLISSIPWEWWHKVLEPTNVGFSASYYLSQQSLISIMFTQCFVLGLIKLIQYFCLKLKGCT